MNGGYEPDRTDAHQRYNVVGEKKTVRELDCYDTARFKVHTKQDMQKAVNMLRRMGFAVQVTRLTETTMVDEEFPSEKGEEGRP